MCHWKEIPGWGLIRRHCQGNTGHQTVTIVHPPASRVDKPPAS